MQQCVIFAVFSAARLWRSFWKSWVFASDMGQLSYRCCNLAWLKLQLLFLSPKPGKQRLYLPPSIR